MTLNLKLRPLNCLHGKQITVVLMTVKYIRQGQALRQAKSPVGMFLELYSILPHIIYKRPNKFKNKLAPRRRTSEYIY